MTETVDRPENAIGIVGVIALNYDAVAELVNPKPPSPQYPYTAAQFDQIYEGMPLSDVEKLLGGPGTEFYRSSVGERTFTDYRWEGTNNRVILISFTDDKVKGISQVGVK